MNHKQLFFTIMNYNYIKLRYIIPYGNMEYDKTNTTNN